MRYSDNYNLKLPQRGVDRANVDDLDDNFGIIDGALADDRQIGLLMYDSTATYNTGAIRGYENPTTHRIRAYRCLEDNVTGPWDATKWAQTTLAAEIEAGGGGGGSSTLAGLSDVDIGTPADGEVLTYDATEGKWVNAEGGSGGASELSDLDDVSLTTPTEGQILTYDGDDWVNTDAPDVDVTKTASGNPIEISDGANAPLVKCVTQITGYQSGTGTPSPDNIRPITAYTEGKIEVRGKNLAKKCIRGYFNAVDGVVKVDNKSESVLFYATQGESYVLSSAVTSAVANRSVLGRVETTNIVNNTPIYNAVEAGYDGKWTATWTGWTLWYKCSNVSTDFENSVQIEKGSTATDYEPYTSTTHTTAYPSAIFRGSEDVVKGEVTSEMPVIDLGDLTWNYANNTFFATLPSDSYKYTTDVTSLCSHYNYIGTVSNGTGDMQNVDDASYALYFNNNYPTSRVLYVKDTRYTNVSTFTTAVTGVKLAYELAAPTTSSVTPTNLPIKSLNGYSHIESSTGDLEVEYIVGKYQPIVDLIQSSQHVYSTQEQIIGTWIDSKTLYEKTLTYNQAYTYSNSGWGEIPFTGVPSDIETAISLDIIGGDDDGMQFNDNRVRYMVDLSGSSPKIVAYSTQTNHSVTWITAIIRYTKSASQSRSVENLSKGSEEEVKKLDEPLEEKKEEPSEPISEPLETKTDSLSEDETELKEEDESKEIEEVTEEPEGEPTEEPVDPEPSKEEADER